MTHLSTDSIVLPITNSQTWRISNTRFRTHVEISGSSLASLSDLAGGANLGKWSKWAEQATGWGRSVFPHHSGLLTDPTGWSQERKEHLAGASLLEYLFQTKLIVSDQGEYERLVAYKTSVLDRKSLGNFHQNVGAYQLLNLRLKDKWRWWHDQKFSSDGRLLRDNLYSWVQNSFIESFFKGPIVRDKRVLDFACGNGYYSGWFEKNGAEVLGVDTSLDLIEIARKNHPRVRFEHASDFDSVSVLRSFPESYFDCIYLSDAMLFFFINPENPKQQDFRELNALLSEFRRILKPEGHFYLMEPNATFWLSGWYGASDLPWTVVTEYLEPTYQVAPTVERLTEHFSNAGFWVKQLIHPRVNQLASQYDLRAYNFAKQFPLWDFYILRKSL